MHDRAHHERVCDGSAIRQMRRASSDIVCENASLNEKLSQVLADLAIFPRACGDDLGTVNWNGVWLGMEKDIPRCRIEAGFATKLPRVSE